MVYFEDNPEFVRSVYQSGLLQSPEVVMNGIGHTSAITAITSTFKSYTRPHAINDASEDIQVRYEQGFQRRTQNYPHINGNPVYASEYIDNVIHGYEEGYYKLLSCASEIYSAIENAGKIRPRYLIRTTAYYTLVMNKIIHPATSRHFHSKFDEIIAEYLNYEGAHPRFKTLIPYEAKCLSHFDIPIFYIDCKSTTLFSEDCEGIPDFLTKTPLEQIKSNFSRSPDYLIHQRELIAGSIHAHLR